MIPTPWLRFCATFSPQLAARSDAPRGDDLLPTGPFRPDLEEAEKRPKRKTLILHGETQRFAGDGVSH
jgi:hypothetical protein